MYIPFHIAMMSKFIAVLPPGEDKSNVAKGELIKMNLKGDWDFNQQVVSNRDEFHWIYRYVGLGYWKVVGKWAEGPWSCQ